MKIHKVLFIVAFIPFLTSLLSAQESKTDRRAINLVREKARDIPLNDAVLVGNTLYISGRGGIDLETMKVPTDPKEEAKLLMEEFKAILSKAEMTMDDLVYVTVYCPDLSLYGTFNEVYKTYFEKDFPARAFVGSGTLLFGIRFEMQGIAAK